jgi:hypothetical protein
MNSIRRTALLSASLLLLVGCNSTGLDTTTQQAMSPELGPEEMMAYMMELGSPNEHHAMLEPMAGKFRGEMIWQMEPDSPPTTSTGVMTTEWILGGRFLMSRWEGEFMGDPFEGLGITGYDNAKQCYIGTWMDSMGTQMASISTGTCDEGGKNFEFTRTMWDPMSQSSLGMREEIRVVDKDHHTFKMWIETPGGDEFQNATIHYTRIADES